MNENKRNQRAGTKIFRGVGYLLLVAAAFCTMVPLLWLLTSSFKTANEIFAVPIQWFPSFPPRVAASPYIVEAAYPKIEKPTMIDETTWNELQPPLTQAIWTKTQTHIVANAQLSNYVPSQKLQTEMIEGLWQQLVTSLPDEIWQGTNTSIIAAVQDAVIPETVDTIWGSVYREVAFGTLQIEDLDFNRTPVEDVKWEIAQGTDARIRPSVDTQTVASLSYDFQNSDTLHITATIPASVPIERIRRITLPIRGDASYHRLSLTVTVLQPEGTMNTATNGITYQPTRPFVLESALWKDSVWRLHGIPGELESSHIVMQQNNNPQLSPEEPNNSKSSNLPTFHTPEATDGNQLRLQLKIHQPAYLSIVLGQVHLKLPESVEDSPRITDTLLTAFSSLLRQRYSHCFSVLSAAMRSPSINSVVRKSCSVSCLPP